jgi:hypothetical protein
MSNVAQNQAKLDKFMSFLKEKGMSSEEIALFEKGRMPNYGKITLSLQDTPMACRVLSVVAPYRTAHGWELFMARQACATDDGFLFAESKKQKPEQIIAAMQSLGLIGVTGILARIVGMVKAEQVQPDAVSIFDGFFAKLAITAMNRQLYLGLLAKDLPEFPAYSPSRDDCNAWIEDYFTIPDELKAPNT